MSTLIDTNMVERWVRLGSHAPSADNELPFIYRWSSQRQQLDICAAPSFAALSPSRRFLAFYAAGALAETMVVAASVDGVRLDISLLESGAAPGLARLAVAGGTAAADPLASQILQRHTNRRLYQRTVLAAGVTDILQREVQGIAGISMSLYEAARAGPLQRLLVQAEAERFYSQVLHEEIFSSVRFDVGWSASCETGIPPIATEVELPMRPMFGLLKHWPLMNALKHIGVHRMLGFRVAGLPARCSATLGVLWSKQSGPADAFATGRALQRVWLSATAQGVAMQPMAAAAVLALDIWPGVRPEVRATLRAGWQEVDRDAQPLMVFRLGYSAPPSGTSGRPAKLPFLVLD